MTKDFEEWKKHWKENQEDFETGQFKLFKETRNQYD